MKKTKPSIAAPGIPKNLLQEPSKLQNIRKTKAMEQPRVFRGTFQNMKKTKPSIAAAGIPKNLCPRTFQTFKISRKRMLRSRPGYAEEPSKTWRKRSLAAAGIPKNLSPGNFQTFKISRANATEQPRVFRGTFQNMKKTSLTSSRGYSDEPSKTWRKHEKAKAKEQPRVCRKTFSRNLPNFKISENEGYGAAPGMPRNLPKTWRKRNLA